MRDTLSSYDQFQYLVMGMQKKTRFLLGVNPGKQSYIHLLCFTIDAFPPHPLTLMRVPTDMKGLIQSIQGFHHHNYLNIDGHLYLYCEKQ